MIRCAVLLGRNSGTRLGGRHVVAAAMARSCSTLPESVETSSGGLFRLLTPEQRLLLSEQRDLTQSARQLTIEVMDHMGIMTSTNKKEDRQRLLQALEQPNVLESTFSIVMAGEFNAGKSTLINALLGEKLLETGALPTTDFITIVTQQPPPPAADYPNLIWHSLPHHSILQDLTLIDTPGTNVVVEDHAARTMRLLPNADLIIFVTSADRPFSQSEKDLLESIQSYRKQILVVINKMDILETAGGHYGQDEKKRVLEYVIQNTQELLGARPYVLGVSARDGLAAKTSGATSTPLWQRSQLGVLQQFLQEQLTMESKLKSKLLNPIGVVEGVLRECLEDLQQIDEDLQVDVRTLAILERQTAGWNADLYAEWTNTRQEIKDRLAEEGDRIRILLQRMGWIDQVLWTMMHPTRLAVEWQATANGGSLESELLRHARETADSVATHGRAQGQAVIEYLGKRPSMKNQSLVGSVTAASSFEDTRTALLDKLSEAVQSILPAPESDADKEVVKLGKILGRTAVLAGALEVGGLSCAAATVFDFVDLVVGMGLTTALLFSGGFAMSQGRSQVEKNYEEEWKRKSELLGRNLETVYAREIDRVERRILDGVAPYTRFVKREQAHVEDLTAKCEVLLDQARTLRKRIKKTSETPGRL